MQATTQARLRLSDEAEIQRALDLNYWKIEVDCLIDIIGVPASTLISIQHLVYAGVRHARIPSHLRLP